MKARFVVFGWRISIEVFRHYVSTREVLEWVAKNRESCGKIDKIIAVRNLTDLGLKEAKEYTEELFGK